MTRWLSVLVVTAWCLGCAGGVGPDDENADPTAQGKADGVGAEGSQMPVPDLNPRYALILDSIVQTQDKDGEEPPKTVLTTIVADVTVDQNDARVMLEIQPCQVTLPELEGRQPEVAPHVVQRIDPVVVEGRLRPANTVVDAPTDAAGPVDFEPSPERQDDAPAEGAPPSDASESADATDPDPIPPVAPEVFELATETAAFVGGAYLDAPLTEPLPEDDDDPRLADLDEDGRPGISIRIGSFSAYASVRLTFNLKGTVDAGRIEGHSVLELDSQIVGDDIPFVDAADRARRAAEATVILEQEHRFTMAPISPNDARCGFEL